MTAQPSPPRPANQSYCICFTKRLIATSNYTFPWPQLAKLLVNGDQSWPQSTTTPPLSTSTQSSKTVAQLKHPTRTRGQGVIVLVLNYLY
jgi:hypothetical protein